MSDTLLLTETNSFKGPKWLGNSKLALTRETRRVSAKTTTTNEQQGYNALTHLKVIKLRKGFGQQGHEARWEHAQGVARQVEVAQRHHLDDTHR